MTDEYEARWSWVWETYCGHPMLRCCICDRFIKEKTSWYMTSSNEWMCETCYDICEHIAKKILEETNG